MLTLRGLLESTNGLYREAGNGFSYSRLELLATLPPEILATAIHLRRVGRGVYSVVLDTPDQRTFDLYSRRRQPRAVSGGPGMQAAAH